MTAPLPAPHTRLEIEQRGLPLDLLGAYGAGGQVHVEDLTDYLAGRERGDAGARWERLNPGYEQLAANLSAATKRAE